MVVRVEVLVNFGAAQAEVGAEVNDRAACVEQGNRVFGRDAVRQSEENDVRLLRQQLGIWFAEAQPGRARVMRKTREDLSERLPGVLSRGDGGELDVRMRQEQAHQFL